MNQRQQDEFYRLSLAVRRLFHKLGHGVAALHRESDISVGMRAVLESVIDGGPQTVPEMARVRPVTRQHILNLVNGLLEGGYVKYIDNPAHKRSKLVSPTDKGRQAFRDLRERESEAFRALSIDPSAAELNAGTSVLRSLIEAFESERWQSIVENKNYKG